MGIPSASKLKGTRSRRILDFSRSTFFEIPQVALQSIWRLKSRDYKSRDVIVEDAEG